METPLKTDPRNNPVTVKEWMFTILITFVPIVNVIMYFIWAFGENTNHNKANWAKATLLWFAIGAGFFVFVLILAGLLKYLR